VTLTFDLWPWKSKGLQILLRTKYVLSLVKIRRRMLIPECSQECYGRTDGRTDEGVTISPRNFVGEGIKSITTVIFEQWINRKNLSINEEFKVVFMYFKNITDFFPIKSAFLITFRSRNGFLSHKWTCPSNGMTKILQKGTIWGTVCIMLLFDGTLQYLNRTNRSGLSL